LHFCSPFLAKTSVIPVVWAELLFDGLIDSMLHTVDAALARAVLLWLLTREFWFGTVPRFLRSMLFHAAQALHSKLLASCSTSTLPTHFFVAATSF
jgi:hypothetical protein